MPKIKSSAPLASNRANGISKTDNAAPARSANSRRPLCGPPRAFVPPPHKRASPSKPDIRAICRATGFSSARPARERVFEKDTLLAAGGEYERVTFHPDYSYANFVGTYKPVPYKDIDGKDAITYSYIPGPFMRIYVKALQNSRSDTSKPFLLVIEELNRANVSAVSAMCSSCSTAARMQSASTRFKRPRTSKSIW